MWLPIVHGEQSIADVVSCGKFHCPQCRKTQTFRLKEVRRYTHLFFIPLRVIERGPRYVECVRCGGKFPEAGLELARAAAEEEAKGRVPEAEEDSTGATGRDLAEASRWLRDGSSLESVRPLLEKMGYGPADIENRLTMLCNGAPIRCACGLRYHPSATRCARCGTPL